MVILCKRRSFILIRPNLFVLRDYRYIRRKKIDVAALQIDVVTDDRVAGAYLADKEVVVQSNCPSRHTRR